jgi:sec-independent protein translocase protein TatB
MIDLSWSHILIVLIVALVVVGPKDLPRLTRIAGRWVAKARAMADQFRKSFDEMARQSELDELRQEIESLRSQRPLADVHAALNQPVLPSDALAAAIDPPKAEESPSPVSAADTSQPDTFEHAEPLKVSSS